LYSYQTLNTPPRFATLYKTIHHNKSTHAPPSSSITIPQNTRHPSPITPYHRPSTL
jgi:hypothetical protein